MTELQKRLFELSDSTYGDFQQKLTPTITREEIIGVRLPVLRKFAKDYIKEAEHEAFLKELPHKYYDENMLHGILLSLQKDFDVCLEGTEQFLPYVDNWAVCDTQFPKIYTKNKEKVFPYIKKWIASEKVYTCRYGICMLMRLFLDDDFLPEYLELPAGVISKEYYVNMMIAWFFATALAKQWDATIPFLEENRLGKWVHNKTIQKAVESYRITDEQKAYLKTLRIK